MDTVLPRKSAVLLMLFERDGETHVVLTKRTETVATHKGQISLPGGVWEPSDESLLQTALRETQEELGIDPRQVEVIGELGVVPTHSTNYDITPFVARLSHPPAYRPDPSEVAEVIEAPLSALRKPLIYWEQEREIPGGTEKLHFFGYGDHIIWGATARILKQFLAANPEP